MVHNGKQIRDLKEYNKSLVIQHFFNHEIVSRRDLIDSTGLAASSISNITRSFQDQGILRNVGNIAKSHAGRKSDLLARNPDAGTVLCISFEPGEVTVSLINMSFIIQNIVRIDIPSKVDKVTLEVIDNELLSIIDSNTLNNIVAIGLTIPDQPFQRFEIKKHLESCFDYPVYMINNVEAMTSAEYSTNFQERYNNLIFTYIGRGVGSAIIRSGELWLGRQNSTNHLGHMYISDNGVSCRCGRKGCLETISSERGISQKLFNSGITDTLYYGDDLIDFILANREATFPVVKDAALYFARAVMNLVSSEDPEVIVVTGRINRLNPLFSNFVNEAFWDNNRTNFDYHPPKIIFHDPQDHPELRGVAIFAFTKFFCFADNL